MVTKIRRITGKQIKLLWVLARQLGMDSDSLHEIVSCITGRESIKDLTVLEAKDLIDGLVQEGARVKKKRKPQRDLPPNVVELVTRQQMKYIRDLNKKLGWQDNPKRLKGFLKKLIKSERVRTKQEAIKTIEGLKSMASRKSNPGKQVNNIHGPIPF